MAPTTSPSTTDGGADMSSTVVNAPMPDRLDKLEKLGADRYIIATGPYGRQFFATSMGYSAVNLPTAVLAELSAGLIKKVVSVSFGSNPNSWFFALEMKDGESEVRIGASIPSVASRFLKQFRTSKILMNSLRFQLGHNDSFLLWSRSVWVASGIPMSLLTKLRLMSGATRDRDNVTMGSLKNGFWPMENAHWSQLGSFYLQCHGHHTVYWKGEVVSGAWSKFWEGKKAEALRSEIQRSLAFVAIDSHAPAGDSFTFFKKQGSEEEPSYMFRFQGGSIYTNAGSEELPETRSAAVKTLEERTGLRWATCKKSGRPHRQEPWELEVEKGEKVKILRDMGRDWLIIENKDYRHGWMHRSWLDLSNREWEADPKTAYMKYRDDLAHLLVPGQLCEFPVMRNYVDFCTKVECQLVKEKTDSLGICAHDLLLLLQGSDDFSYEWVKGRRNVWHPDRFGRFCHAEHMGRLKPLAEQMFVLFGLVMELA